MNILAFLTLDNLLTNNKSTNHFFKTILDYSPLLVTRNIIRRLKYLGIDPVHSLATNFSNYSMQMPNVDVVKYAYQYHHRSLAISRDIITFAPTYQAGNMIFPKRN